MSTDQIKRVEQHVLDDHLLSLWDYRKRGLLTDVAFEVDSRIFNVHKVILVAQSGYFYQYFSSPQSLHYADVHVVHHVTPITFRHFLEVVYGITPKFDDWKEMISLCHYLKETSTKTMMIEVLVGRMVSVPIKEFVPFLKEVVSLFPVGVPHHIKVEIPEKLNVPINLSVIDDYYFVKRIIEAYNEKYNDMCMTYELVHQCVNNGMPINMYDIIDFSSLPRSMKYYGHDCLPSLHGYHYKTANRYLKNKLICDIQSQTPIDCTIVHIDDDMQFDWRRAYKHKYEVETKYGSFTLSTKKFITSSVGHTLSIIVKEQNWARRAIYE